MPPNGDNYFVPPEQGGLWHPAAKIPSHMDLGLKDTAFMTSTVAMSLTTQSIGDSLIVTVTLTNAGAGHHVPTDHPGRHMILTVTAMDERGQILRQQSGPIVPGWGGAQTGLPGKAFAKILKDAVTGENPVVSYWKQTFIASDNRIPAKGSDTSIYIFKIPPEGGEIAVDVILLFRRTFQTDMEARGWGAPDIVMNQSRIVISAPPAWNFFLPLVTR
jgi:hypothetical protein